MEICIYYTEVETENTTLRCDYRVLKDEGGYGICCCLEGYVNEMDSHHYCCLHEIFSREEEAEEKVRLLAQKQVMPVHIKDVLEDWIS